MMLLVVVVLDAACVLVVGARCLAEDDVVLIGERQTVPSVVGVELEEFVAEFGGDLFEGGEVVLADLALVGVA